MTFDDWRDASAAEVQALFEAECLRWQTGLEWDLRPSVRVLEEARAAGRLPGLLARDRQGHVVGWTYFIVHDGILQVGGVVAQRASVLRHLLDRVLEAPEAARARALTCFVYPVSESLRIALERRRFTIQGHPYLHRSLEGAEARVPPLPDGLVTRPFRELEPADVVRLFARAYAGSPEARCFAADGRLDQWAQYLGQLLGTPGCGTFVEAASLGVVRRDGGQLLGVVLTTAVSERTAHIAQVAVDPSAQGSGLASGLIQLASVKAVAAGFGQMTLIVADSNDRAQRLYDRLGFTRKASFLYGYRPALTRRTATVPSDHPSLARA